MISSGFGKDFPGWIPSQRLRRAVRTIHAGGIVAYPTEGVYGLGCDPWDPAAVLRLLQIKRRPIEAGLIVIAGRIEQLEGLILPQTGVAARRMARTWPGPVTWVTAAGPAAPVWLTGGRDTLAVRVSAHPVARALCLAAETALVSTSANVRGRPAARSALAVRARLGEHVDFVMGGRTGGLAGPTELRDAASGRVLRRQSGRLQ